MPAAQTQCRVGRTRGKNIAVPEQLPVPRYFHGRTQTGARRNRLRVTGCRRVRRNCSLAKKYALRTTKTEEISMRKLMTIAAAGALLAGIRRMRKRTRRRAARRARARRARTSAAATWKAARRPRAQPKRAKDAPSVDLGRRDQRSGGRSRRRHGGCPEERQQHPSVRRRSRFARHAEGQVSRTDATDRSMAERRNGAPPSLFSGSIRQSWNSIGRLLFQRRRLRGFVNSCSKIARKFAAALQPSDSFLRGVSKSFHECQRHLRTHRQ